MKKAILCILSVVAVLGCTTLSKNECLEADWFEIGHRDGTMGKPRSVFQDHLKACRKYAVVPSRELYNKGRDEGLKSYCTYESGFEQGKGGKKNNHVCPPEMAPSFLSGYDKGREIYEYESKINSLKSRMKRMERDIRIKEEKLHSAAIDDNQRARIRSDLRKLDIEYRDLVRELNCLERTKPVS